MVRIIVTLVLAAIVGFAIGKAEVFWTLAGIPEHLHLPEHSAAVAAGNIEVGSFSGNPKIELPDGSKFDFGQMRHGSSMTHEFTIRNIGEGPLNLEKKGSTCKCTVGNLAESVLMPGQETKITLECRPDSGCSLCQSATFKTNDPANTELNCRSKEV